MKYFLIVLLLSSVSYSQTTTTTIDTTTSTIACGLHGDDCRGEEDTTTCCPGSYCGQYVNGSVPLHWYCYPNPDSCRTLGMTCNSTKICCSGAICNWVAEGSPLMKFCMKP